MITMAIERVYNIPLRKTFLKVPRYKRTNKAITALRDFIIRHMKSEDIRIGKNLNQELWKNGIKNPPHHVKVTLIKEDSGLVKAELFGFKFDEPTKDDIEKMKEGKKKKEEKINKEDKKKELKKKVEKDVKQKLDEMEAKVKETVKEEKKAKAVKKAEKEDSE
jgi:large subunit ribosomal protein L31e